MGRDTNPRKSLGFSLHSAIKASRVLMVGAGGIGCELLKNLVLTGFGEVVIVDLDTIDLSNLNRQFLFGMQHIKKSKALIAKETAGKFNPNVKLEALHANIKDPQFNVKWFKGFNIVFNALDNLDARKHVNRMCLAADVPLIESGTTGYNGQVQVIKGGETECYDCNTKPVPKSFPVCTIRSTPSQPIHCIVWAKSYLFAEVFGTSEESSPELDPTEDSDNAQEIANLKREAEELKNIREKLDQPDFAESVFQKVFKRDVERSLSMEEMWKSRKKPTPLDFNAVTESAKNIDAANLAKKDQAVWTLAENYAVFADSLKRLAGRMIEMKANMKEGDAPPVLSFDKDDEDTLDFVAASANLRSLVFDIEVKSKFDIKQMAGNIIPAIATTNAITAGLCVLQAFKILKNDIQAGRMVFLTKSAERALTAETLAPPKPSCETCGVARLSIEADISRVTLGDIVKNLVTEGLGYSEEISVLTTNLLYDPDFDDNLDTPLKELGFGEETFVTVVDEDAEADETGPRVNLVIAVTNNSSLPADGPGLEIPDLSSFNIGRKPKKAPEPEPTVDSPVPVKSNGATINGGGSNSPIDIDMIEPSDTQSDADSSKKRKLDPEVVMLEDREAKKKVIVPESEINPVPTPVAVTVCAAEKSNEKLEAEVLVVDDDGAIYID